MADISSYPRKAPKLGDLILFSETYDVNAAYPVTGNPTKTTTVGALVSLVEASGSGTVVSVTPQSNRVSGTPITTSGVINFANGTNTTVGILGDTITINASSSGVSSVGGGTGITVNSDTTTAPVVSLDYGTTNYIVSTPQRTPVEDIVSSNFIGLSSASQAFSTTLGSIPVTALPLVQSYIEDTISGGAIFQSGYNATDNIPDLSTGIGIGAGFMYTVTVAGNAFYSQNLQVGDVLISKQAIPTVVDHWVIVEDDINIYNLSTENIPDNTGARLKLDGGPANTLVDIKGSGGTSISVVGSEIVVAGLALGATDITALAGNTTTITSDQATAIVANTAKDGITTTQAGEISVNTSKVGYTEAAVSANASVVANTAKVGITTVQATAITDSVKNNTNPSGTNKVTNIVTLTSYPPAVVDANTLYIII
jgi:hypothetical protein